MTKALLAPMRKCWHLFKTAEHCFRATGSSDKISAKSCIDSDIGAYEPRAVVKAGSAGSGVLFPFYEQSHSSWPSLAYLASFY